MNRLAATGLIALTQILLIGAAIAPQATARLTGDTYLVRVAPIDPIDPYRGAYVDLGYPDLQMPANDMHTAGLGTFADREDREGGPVYVTLRRSGDVWVADEFLRSRPEDGPYLACSDESWDVRCGIESWFLPQDQARQAEDDLTSGAYAELKVDSRGNAALVEVRGTSD